MIELELQALAFTRERLFTDVGRIVSACGFTLVRQRLADDRHGILLTMVVRGPERKQRELEAALGAEERIVSFQLAPYEPGTSKPHFAASRVVAADYVPPPAPPAEPPSVQAGSAPDTPARGATQPVPSALPAMERIAPAPLAQAARPPVLAAQAEPEFVFVRSAPTATPAPAPEVPFVELIRLDADLAAVDSVLPQLMGDYPQIFPWLKKLEQAVEEGARESSLELAGRRIGHWVFERQHAAAARSGVDEAMQRIGVPALRTLMDVDYHGQQLHIRNSPLCTEDGRSSCKFFSGFLEGLLGPAVASRGLSIFAVCCRSCGADECVLAVMD